MRIPRRPWLLAAVALIALLVGVWAFWPGPERVRAHAHLDRPPRIKPDYAGIVIPPNIAPLNFAILEPAGRYFVRVYGQRGDAIVVTSGDGDIRIPPDRWKALLADNVGADVKVDVFAHDRQDGWCQYETITNKVAAERIDPVLVYRFIRPIYSFWRHTAIYQRNIEGYDRRLIFDGGELNRGCVNCHTFCRNSPEKMTIGMRSKDYGSGTLMAIDGRVDTIKAKWGYTSWHPSGRLAAYSINKVRQFFHTTGPECRDVIDMDSAILYYEVATKETKTAPGLSSPDRLETYPEWSPDGKYLYYCSAAIPWMDRGSVPPPNFDKVRYDLMRMPYDIQTDTWGRPEVILSAAEIGGSILLPRVSPDGRCLVFAMCDYGCFPVFRESSDLYLMDLAVLKYKKLEINSEQSESWHSFSANGRWLAFSSKRERGPFTRTYFSYLDPNGVAHKPFVLPQEDPAYYDSLLFTYSVPELLTGPISVSPRALAAAVRDKEQIAVTSPIVTGATPRLSSVPERE